MDGDSAGEGATGRARASRSGHRRALALIVSLTFVGMLGIGWLVDGLTSAPTPATQWPLTRQVGQMTVTLSANPLPLHAQQPESFILRVTDESGARVVGVKARCAFSMPEIGKQPPSEEATLSGQSGEYVCGPRTLDVGVWSLEVTITLPDSTVGHATFYLNVT